MSAKQFSSRKIWHLSREEKYRGGKEHLAAEPEQAEARERYQTPGSWGK